MGKRHHWERGFLRQTERRVPRSEGLSNCCKKQRYPGRASCPPERDSRLRTPRGLPSEIACCRRSLRRPATDWKTEALLEAQRPRSAAAPLRSRPEFEQLAKRLPKRTGSC